YDAITSSLVVTPLSAIRQEIVDRWKESQRDLTVRDLASRIAEAWTEGRRDRSLESRVEIREPGAMTYGASLGTDPAAAAVTDTLRRREYDRHVETVPYPNGCAVVDA